MAAPINYSVTNHNTHTTQHSTLDPNANPEIEIIDVIAQDTLNLDDLSSTESIAAQVAEMAALTADIIANHPELFRYFDERYLGG